MTQAPTQLHVIACMDVMEMTALWSVQETVMEKGYVSTMKTQIQQNVVVKQQLLNWKN